VELTHAALATVSVKPGDRELSGARDVERRIWTTVDGVAWTMSETAPDP
jgi:hypothetical protein